MPLFATRSRRSGGFVALLVFLASAGALASTPHVRLELVVDAARRQISGLARWTLTNTSGVTLDRIDFSLYANRFAEQPAWLSGLTWFRVYPGGFDPAWTRVRELSVDGEARALPPGPERGVRFPVVLAASLAPGASIAIGLRFETRIPERFGPFGAAEGLVTLEGGYYPVPLAFGPDGQRDDVPPPAHGAHVILHCERSGDVLVGGRQRRCRAGEPTRPVVLSGIDGVALQLRPFSERIRADVQGHRIDLVYTPPRRDRPLGDPAAPRRDPLTGAPAWPRFDDLGWLDRPGEALQAAEDALRFLVERAPALAPRRLRLIEAPLKRQLALPGPGAVWISTRLLRLTPVERLRKFHRIALVRALFAQAARGWLDGRETAEDRDWIADIVAEHLTHAYIIARYEVEEDAFDVLAPGAFVAAIDDVLYAPQMPFSTAYFNVIDDTDPQRESYRLFFGSRPTGRRIYEKLRDRLGATELAALVHRYLEAPTTPFRQLDGAPPASFFAQWLGPYPPGNVRLGGIASRRATPSDAHDGAARFVHTAFVLREGEHAPTEPVTVRFSLRDGRHEDVVWDGEGDTAEVELRDDEPLVHVGLDPKGRLVQWLPGVADDLRLDDRTALELKVLLERLFFTLTPTSGAFSAEAEIVFQRRYDIRHKVGLYPFLFPSKSGASVYYAYGFGPRVRANRLGGFVVGTFRAAAVESTGRREPGFVLQLGAGYSDVVTPFDMMRQNVATAVARYLLSPSERGTLHGGQIELAGSLVRAPHPRHRLGIRLALGTTFGEVARGERFALGGPAAVRAIGPTEWRGRHRVALGFEYRHTFTRSMSLSLAQLAWLDGIEGVLFVDGGVAADRWGDMASAHSAVVGIGYGLRLHLAVLGIQPAMLAIDVAYPLPLSARLRQRAGSPVGVHVYFAQNF